MVSDLDRFLHQSPYSTPGRYAGRLAVLPDDLGSLCAASRNVIGHYRAELPDLPEERRGEIDSRWLEIILALDQQRHPAGLDQPRPAGERVAGCCRDHSLLVVGALRQLLIGPASRPGTLAYQRPIDYRARVPLTRRLLGVCDSTYFTSTITSAPMNLAPGVGLPRKKVSPPKGRNASHSSPQSKPVPRRLRGGRARDV